MKKICLFVLLLFVAAQSMAQQNVKFVYKYLPNHSYLSNVTVHSNGEVNITGSADDMEKLKAAGANNKMVLVGTSDMEYLIKTGAYKADNTFPVMLTYKSIVNKQFLDGKEFSGNKSGLLGLNIYGHSDHGGKLNVDSVGGAANGKDSIAKVVATIMDNFNKQINFPVGAMKVGESFTQDMPMNLPIMGNNVSVAMTLTYKLTAINNNIGYFDVTQNMGLTLTAANTPVEIKGSGKSKLEFSIENNFPIKYDSLSEITYKMKVENLSVEGLVKIGMLLETKIN